MITYLNKRLTDEMLASAVLQLPDIDFKLTINQPTGDFFYDPWVVAPEFVGTVWEDILSMIPSNVGEARLIRLKKKECYMAHADIDNRWHVPLIMGKSFLVDLDNNKMHKLAPGCLYYMDASKDHSAVNFGGEDRVQLVVRELLTHGEISHPLHVTIKPKVQLENIRYLFDNIYSPILNLLNIDGFMNNFKVEGDSVSFDLESQIKLPEHEAFELIVDSL